jgi:adenylyltransferase/sulfurtransferase
VHVFHRVLVAGIGALGSEIVQNLGLLGCESVFLADADAIEEKNIARSLLMRNGVLGVSKVTHTLAQLKRWFPQTQWQGAPVEIADVEAQHFLNADVIFSCVDTDLARTEIAALAARYKLPVCDAGLGGTSTRIGRISWFPADDSEACFSCLLTGRRRAEIFSIWESDVHSCWASGVQETPAWTSTPTMASIVAGLQIETAISAAKNSFSMSLDLDHEPPFQEIRHNRSAECPLHGETAGIPFPICTLAECRVCGQQFSPNRRIAWIRRRGACPSCGNRDLIIRASTRDELIGSAA